MAASSGWSAAGRATGFPSGIAKRGEIAYDELPYSKYPHPQTHPDRLATIATLHGLDAAPPRRCTVLELGCGAGGNVIPLAAVEPKLEAVGVDRVGSAIAGGRETIAALGLDNVRLVERDVRELAAGELGTFDYVIAHGVYSWVDAETRDRLLAACKSHLAPEGIAYVSYNAHPGGYLRKMLRDAGLWQARSATSVTELGQSAQELFRTLAAHGAAHPFGPAFLDEVRRVAGCRTYLLVHDDLAEHWDPVWFVDFAAHAERHGLAFVGEADPDELGAIGLPDEAQQAFEAMADGDRVALEQYYDLVLGRRFRQTLLCHSGRAISPRPTTDRVCRLQVLARRRPERPAAELLPRALSALAARWPLGMTFAALRDVLDAAEEPLAAALLDGFRAALVDFAVDPPRLASKPPQRPRISALARLQAANGTDLTSLRHENVRIDDEQVLELIALLDGTRDVPALRAELALEAPEPVPALERLAALGFFEASA